MIERIETDFGRFYKCEGEYYPSVTTMISKMSDTSGLDTWRKFVGEEEANKISRQSTDRGTELHLKIEKYLKKEEYDPRFPMVKWMFSTIKPYLDKISEIHLQEEFLYSKKLRVAGAVDCVGKYEGEGAIIDFKNSNKMKDKDDIKNYFIQTTLYSIMYRERFQLTLPNIVIIMATESMKPLIFKDKASNYIDETLLLVKNFYKKYNNDIKQKSLFIRN